MTTLSVADFASFDDACLAMKGYTHNDQQLMLYLNRLALHSLACEAMPSNYKPLTILFSEATVPLTYNLWQAGGWQVTRGNKATTVRLPAISMGDIVGNCKGRADREAKLQLLFNTQQAIKAIKAPEILGAFLQPVTYYLFTNSQVKKASYKSTLSPVILQGLGLK